LTTTEYTDAYGQCYNRGKSPGFAMEVHEIAKAALEILENPGINGAVLSVDRGIQI
jgi:hypothetical protein